MDRYKITRNIYTVPTERSTARLPVRRPQAPTAEPIVYSVVVPFHNEAGVVEKLCHRVNRVMRRLGKGYEVILVNDGSDDETGRIIEQIARCDDRVTGLDLRRNFGQATALQAGLDAAIGSILITMDGNLRHDPYEIPLFVRKLAEGYDIASGCRRGDRGIFSRAGNWMLSKVAGVRGHDFGTTFMAYRREVLEGVRLYGDMHRFLPAVCGRLGAKVCQVPIKNVPRASGNSHGRIRGLLRAARSLLVLQFMAAYLAGPLRVFGKWGAVTGLAGVGILIYGLVRKLLDWKSSVLAEHGLLMAGGFILVVTSTMLLATGLIGDLLMRICFETAGNKSYAVRRVIRRDPPAQEPDGQ